MKTKSEFDAVRLATSSFRCEATGLFGDSLALERCTHLVEAGERYLERRLNGETICDIVFRRHCMTCAQRKGLIAELPERDRVEMLAFRFSDLGGSVLDLERMAKLAASVVEEHVDQTPIFESSPSLVHIDGTSRDMILFAVQHVQDLATDLMQRYFEIAGQMPVEKRSNPVG